MCRARVKQWDMRKGYGFVTLKNDEDVIIHWSDVEKRKNEDYICLNRDELLEFDIEETHKGLKGLNVKRIDNQRKLEREELGGIKCVN